jgi:hypothetical protein
MPDAGDPTEIIVHHVGVTANEIVRGCKTQEPEIGGDGRADVRNLLQIG